MRGRYGWLGLSGVLSLACAPAPAQESTPRAVTLLHTSDIHSRLWPYRSRISDFEAGLGLGEVGELAELGGIARLATRLRAARSRGPALWLDSGDALEGAPVFRRFGGRAELAALSQLGLGAMALGNHELSLSSEQLSALLKLPRSFPVLSANLRPRPGSALSGEILTSTLIDLGGLAVGVVAVANPRSPPSLSAPGNSWGLAVLPSAAAVQQALDELSGRARFLVVLSHLGLEQDRELVAATSGIDVLLGGHQHIVTAEPEWAEDCGTDELRRTRGCAPRRVPIVHSGAYARWLSRLELALSQDEGPPFYVELERLELIQEPLGERVPLDSAVIEWLQRFQPDLEPPLAFLPAPVSRTGALGGDSPLGDLAADAMLRASHADVVLLNTSGLRADLEPGALLPSDLELAFPFEEPWRLTWTTGAVLRRGLVRAARKSAAQRCTSTLQAAGLRLRMDCRACEAGSGACVEAWHGSPLGEVRLTDSSELLVALPTYLTLPGADFEELGEAGSELEGAVAAAVARRIQQEPRQAGHGCARGLQQLSPARCEQAFGAASCPLGVARSEQVCAQLPRLEVVRDERIEAH